MVTVVGVETNPHDQTPTQHVTQTEQHARRFELQVKKGIGHQWNEYGKVPAPYVRRDQGCQGQTPNDGILRRVLEPQPGVGAKNADDQQSPQEPSQRSPLQS